MLAAPCSGRRLQGRSCPCVSQPHQAGGHVAPASAQPPGHPPVCQRPHHTSLIRMPVTGLRVHLVLTGNVRPPLDSSLQHIGQDPWVKQDDSQSSWGSALTAQNGPPRVGQEDAMSPRPVPTAPLAPLTMLREEEPHLGGGGSAPGARTPANAAGGGRGLLPEQEGSPSIPGMRRSGGGQAV